MTRTRSSSPGRTGRLHRVRERVDVHHPDALELGDPVRGCSRSSGSAAAAARASATSLASTSATSRTVVLDDLDRASVSPSACRARISRPRRPRLRRSVSELSAMCWSSSRHEPRDDKRAVDEARFDDLGDPAVDDRARVDDDVRLADDRPAAVVARPGAGRSRPASAAISGVLALARRSGRHAEAEDRPRRPAAGTVPNGSGSPLSGRPSSRPIRRPIRRPMIAVTNSAVEKLLDLAEEPRGGLDRDVRAGSPNPTIIQATVHSATSAPAASNSAEQALAGRREDESDGASQQGTQDADDRINGSPRGWHRPRLARGHDGRQPSIAATGLATRARGRLRAPRTASAGAGDHDDLHRRTRLQWSMRPGAAGHDRPCRTRAVQPRGGGRSRPATGRTSPSRPTSPDGDRASRSRADPAGTRRGPGRSAGSGPGSITDRPPARLA